nr:MAG TPA: hypothetical protein [Caudoviricetes sp.]
MCFSQRYYVREGCKKTIPAMDNCRNLDYTETDLDYISA